MATNPIGPLPFTIQYLKLANPFRYESFPLFKKNLVLTHFYDIIIKF